MSPDESRMHLHSSTSSFTPATQGIGEPSAISLVLMMLLLGHFTLGGEWLPFESCSPSVGQGLFGQTLCCCAVTTCSLEQAQAGVWEPQTGKSAQILTSMGLYSSDSSLPCRCSSFSVFLDVSVP